MAPLSPLPRPHNPLDSSIPSISTHDYSTDTPEGHTHTPSPSPPRSPSPPFAHLTHLLSSFSTGLFSSPQMDSRNDLEKAAFLPSHPSSASISSSSTSSGSTSTLPHLGLRRRRLIGQTLAVLTLVSLGGWMVLGSQGTGSLLDTTRWRSTPSISISDYPSAELDDTPIPGIMIGANGSPLDTSPPQTQTLSHAEHMAELAHIQAQQWGLTLSASRLLQGLRLWPPDPPADEGTEPLSVLGRFADEIYKYGPLEMEEYSAQLFEFVREAFPKKVGVELKQGLEKFITPPIGITPESVDGERTDEAAWDTNKNVWQTDKDTKYENNADVGSWRNGQAKGEGWKWDLMTDAEANTYIRKNLGGSKMLEVWDNLPSGILRSDTLRYLMLLLEGGVYSDTDTVLLKPPSVWGRDARLWKSGQGWLSEEDKARIDAGEAIDAVLGKPSVIVGLEADVGNREDWFDWWPRPIQIVQWTMASSPSHPIALQALLRILHSTANAIDWAHDTARVVKILKDQGRYDDAKNLANVGVLDEPKNGGPVGVMAWTGPGVWTDAVLSYLRVKYGLVWTDLKGIQEPLRVGDVVILPVTGFSPGVGNFGSQGTWHREAMVQHKFRGSWKPQEHE